MRTQMLQHITEASTLSPWGKEVHGLRAEFGAVGAVGECVRFGSCRVAELLLK